MNSNKILVDQDSKIVKTILKIVEKPFRQPTFICIDGRSGVGKSSVALKIGSQFPTTVINSDDFYCNLETEKLIELSIKDRYEKCIDHKALAQKVLEPLRKNKVAEWTDFHGNKHNATAKTLVIIEGLYCSGPELRDYFDYAFLIEMNESLRIDRLLAREPLEQFQNWRNIFDAVEDYYFNEVVNPDSYTKIFEFTG